MDYTKLGALGKAALNTATKAPAKEIAAAQDQMLGALVAYRQMGALEKAAEHLKINPEQFVRGYAGDQRSANAVRKTMQEQENVAKGLPASPGRRKVMKQAASAALQSQLPGGGLVSHLASPLEEGLARSLSEAGIPQVNPRDISSKLHSFITEGNMGDELHDIGSELIYPKLLDHTMEHFYPKDKLHHLNSAVDKLIKHPWDGVDEYTSAGDLLYSGELSRALKGKRPSSLDPEEWVDLKDSFKSHSLTPEELSALEHLEKKVMPSPTEGMDAVMVRGSMGEPPTGSQKEFNRWVDEHANKYDEINWDDGFGDYLDNYGGRYDSSGSPVQMTAPKVEARPLPQYSSDPLPRDPNSSYWRSYGDNASHIMKQGPFWNVSPEVQELLGGVLDQFKLPASGFFNLSPEWVRAIKGIK